MSFPAPTGQTREVLCLTTVTQLDATPLTSRNAVKVYNHGPNPVWIVISTGTPGVTAGKADQLMPEDEWGPHPITEAVHVYGLTSANQVTGAACIVTEY